MKKRIPRYFKCSITECEKKPKKMAENDNNEENCVSEERMEPRIDLEIDVKLEPEYEDEFRNLENGMAAAQAPKVCKKEIVEAVDLKKDGSKPKKGRNGEFFCSECSYFTKRNDKLKLHIRTKHEGLRFPCDRCNYEALRPDKLRDHKRNVHQMEMVYNCIYCDFKVGSYRELQIHHKTHPNKEHACKYCSYTTKRPRRLREHIERKHENGAYPCDSCEYIAPSNLSLTRHKENKHTTMRYSCDLCDYQAKRPDTLLNHKKRKHEEELEASIFGLNEDEDDIKQESMLEDVEEADPGAHFLEDRSNGGKENLAETEELDVIDPSLWLFHQGLGEVKAEVEDLSDVDYEIKCDPVHFMADDSGLVDYDEDEDEEDYNDDDNEDPTFKLYTGAVGAKKPSTVKKKYPRKLGHFTCDLCDYTSQRKDKVRLHARAVHEGVRYPCDMCTYAATRPDKLKLHKVRKHFDPKPRKVRKPKYAGVYQHMCDKCDYKTEKIRNLQAHMVRNHSDSVFHCDQCDYVANFKLNLKHHHDRMHGGKTLMCEKCNYTTRDINRLRYHNQSKHEDNKYPCDQCEYVGSILCELKRHIRRKHGSEKFCCQLCDYVAKRIDHLRDHMKRIHEPKSNSSLLTSPDKKPGVDQLHQFSSLDFPPVPDPSSYADQKPVISQPGVLYQSPKQLNYTPYTSLTGAQLARLPGEQDEMTAVRPELIVSHPAALTDQTSLIQLPKAENSARNSYSELRDFYLYKIDQPAQRQSVIIGEGSSAAIPRELVIQQTGQVDPTLLRANVIERNAAYAQLLQGNTLNGVSPVKIEQEIGQSKVIHTEDGVKNSVMLQSNHLSQ